MKFTKKKKKTEGTGVHPSENNHEEEAGREDDHSDQERNYETVIHDVEDNNVEDVLNGVEEMLQGADQKRSVQSAKGEENAQKPRFRPVEMTKEQKETLGFLKDIDFDQLSREQLEMILGKLETQFNQLVHENLVGSLKQTDEYTFAKEYLDIEIRPLKFVVEQIKKMMAALQNKQITLYDDVLSLHNRMEERMNQREEGIHKMVSGFEDMLRSTKQELYNQIKTMDAKIENEIGRVNRNLEDLSNEILSKLFDSIRKERKDTEDSIGYLRDRFDESNEKLKERLSDLISESREKMELENKKISREMTELSHKVQQSLRTLSEYLVLAIDAADVRKKIDKLSYDSSLEDLKTVNL